MNVKKSPFRTLTRPKAVEDIVETFKQAIIRGELQPGQRLPSEAELSQQLGVGRGTVREAMKMLEALGVVNIQRGDGTYLVDEPSPTLLSPLVFAIMLEARTGIELLELRSLIQTGYCQLAAQKATREDWERIEQAEKAFEAYARSAQRDVDRLAQLDLDFHYALLEATHNPLVIRIGHTVEELFFASIGTTLSKMENMEQGIRGHRQIIKAVRTNDPKLIYQVVIDSLVHWGKEVISQP